MNSYLQKEAAVLIPNKAKGCPVCVCVLVSCVCDLLLQKEPHIAGLVCPIMEIRDINFSSALSLTTEVVRRTCELVAGRLPLHNGLHRNRECIFGSFWNGMMRNKSGKQNQCHFCPCPHLDHHLLLTDTRASISYTVFI